MSVDLTHGWATHDGSAPDLRSLRCGGVRRHRYPACSSATRTRPASPRPGSSHTVGDGRVDVSAIQSGQVTPPAGLFGITSRGFARADSEGNGDGQASVKEVRALLKQYDVGNGWDPGTAGDKAIDGVELLRLLQDLSTPKQSSAPEQASAGARQAA